MKPSCGNVIAPLVRPITVSSPISYTSPGCPPSITRWSDPLGGADCDEITIVLPKVMGAPQLAQNALPILLDWPHCVHKIPEGEPTGSTTVSGEGVSGIGVSLSGVVGAV